MLPTLSIGLVSVNFPLSSYAQNSALSQDGNDRAEQDTEQSQSSNQVNQIVIGDSNILSGNNLMCHDQENMKSMQVLTETCNVEQINLPLFGKTAKLNVETDDELCG